MAGIYMTLAFIWHWRMVRRGWGYGKALHLDLLGYRVVDVRLTETTMYVMVAAP